jgi:chromosome segregation ATPase
MSFEPRMRGKRFLRPTSRKTKHVREARSDSTRGDQQQVDPADIAANTLNAVDHLGNQRFALPPFSEHFERWLKDLQSLLEEFESRVPQAATETLRKDVKEKFEAIKENLSRRAELETKKSDEFAAFQQQLAKAEVALSQLESEYRNQTQEARRHHAKSEQELQLEIDTLHRQRLENLRKKTSIFQRILRKPQTTIQETDAALEIKRGKLRESEQNLAKTLKKQKNDYTSKRQKLLEEINLLKQQIQTSKVIGDDALESRKQACEQIHLTIGEAMRRIQAGTPTTTNAS